MTTLVNVETEPTAHVIQDDQEAIAVAKELAAEFLQEDSLQRLANAVYRWRR
ncbi:MAG UNVERIFIED_CONTAM: hypothetical protein LVR29_18360 [Microcystis novacekii LVE1205-3]|jgi:hypothetical protein